MQKEACLEERFSCKGFLYDVLIGAIVPVKGDKIIHKYGSYVRGTSFSSKVEGTVLEGATYFLKYGFLYPLIVLSVRGAIIKC